MSSSNAVMNGRRTVFDRAAAVEGALDRDADGVVVHRSSAGDHLQFSAFTAEGARFAYGRKKAPRTAYIVIAAAALRRVPK